MASIADATLPEPVSTTTRVFGSACSRTGIGSRPLPSGMGRSSTTSSGASPRARGAMEFLVHRPLFLGDGSRRRRGGDQTHPCVVNVAVVAPHRIEAPRQSSGECHECDAPPAAGRHPMDPRMERRRTAPATPPDVPTRLHQRWAAGAGLRDRSAMPPLGRAVFARHRSPPYPTSGAALVTLFCIMHLAKRRFRRPLCGRALSGCGPWRSSLARPGDARAGASFRRLT